MAEKPKPKTLLAVSFLETNPLEVRLVKYLRSVKERFGDEAKTQIVRGLMILFDTYAIGEDSTSSISDIEEALVRSLNALSGQMSEQAAYCRSRHGIDLTPESWKRFGVLPVDSLLEKIPVSYTAEASTPGSIATKPAAVSNAAAIDSPPI